MWCIITPSDIRNCPNFMVKDSDMWCTQYDNLLESAGLQNGFLGLKTLTLIKDTVKIIKAMTEKLLILIKFL